MKFRFQKRIKIAPGVRINLSKTGISTTVGKEGLSINSGKNGTYLNAGAPGTGLSTRTRLTSKAKAGETPSPRSDRDMPESAGSKAITWLITILLIAATMGGLAYLIF